MQVLSELSRLFRMGICLDTGQRADSLTLHDLDEDRAGSPLVGDGRNGEATTTAATTPQTTAGNTTASEAIAGVPVIFFLGGPGSGKMTHAQNLADIHEGYRHINLTVIISEYIKENAKKSSSKGDKKYGGKRLSFCRLLSEEPDAEADVFLPDLGPPSNISASIALALLAREMQVTPRCQGYLVSGYPRNLDDVKHYTDKLGRPTGAVLLEWDRSTLVRNIEMGNVDGAILLDWRESALLNNLEAGAKMGSILLDAARKELADFHGKVIPVCEHYDNLGLLYVVSGERSQEEVFRDVQRAHARIIQPPPQPPPSRASVETTEPLTRQPQRRNGSKHRRNGKNGNQNSNDGHYSNRQQQQNTKRTNNGQNDEQNGSYREYRSMAPFKARQPLSTSAVNSTQELKNLPPCLLFMGGPGSDKWRLVSGITYLYPGWACIGIGQLLRDHVDRWRQDPDNYSDLSAEKVIMIQDLMMKGELVPQDLVLLLLHDKLETLKSREGVVVVGYPRDIIQAQTFEEKFHQIPPLLLVDCSELELGRNLGRRENRLDDNVASARRRLTIYREVTLPMLKAFDEKNRLKIIDGDADSEQVEREVKRAIYVETQNLARRPPRISADDDLGSDQFNGHDPNPEVEVRSLSNDFADVDIAETTSKKLQIKHELV